MAAAQLQKGEKGKTHLETRESSDPLLSGIGLFYVFPVVIISSPRLASNEIGE
jgi:hypothetical protein